MTWNGKLDGYLQKNLDIAKKAITDDWDMVFAIDGYEGSGKSVLAQQCAKYCDPSFDLIDIAFTGEDFLKKVAKAVKYKSIIYDEAMEGMDAASYMQELNRSLKSAMAELRQKNLFIFIVLPTFFDLTKYVGIWRSRALIHVYTGDNFKRGMFAFYSQERKKLLYVFGKKFYSYKRPSPNFLGRFSKGYAVDEVAYRQAKYVALQSRARSEYKREGEREKMIRLQRNTAILLLIQQGMSKKDVADRLGITDRQIRNISTDVSGDRSGTEMETEQNI